MRKAERVTGRSTGRAGWKDRIQESGGRESESIGQRSGERGRVSAGRGKNHAAEDRGLRRMSISISTTGPLVIDKALSPLGIEEEKRQESVRREREKKRER